MAQRRRLSPEEADLWHRAMRSTVPLPGVRLPEAPPLPPKARQAGPDPTPVPAPIPKPSPARPSPHDPLSGGLDGATMRRARRGQIAPEGRLDLHGLTLHGARGALERFLRRARTKRWRCVLIITGKGGRVRRSAEDAPFMGGETSGSLRRQVPLWLGQDPLRSLVYAVRSAHRKDGGAGALYVFLRKTE